MRAKSSTLYIYIYSNSGPQVDPLSLRGLEGLSLTRIRSPIHRLTNSKRQLILHHISISLLSVCVCVCARISFFFVVVVLLLMQETFTPHLFFLVPNHSGKLNRLFKKNSLLRKCVGRSFRLQSRNTPASHIWQFYSNPELLILYTV